MPFLSLPDFLDRYDGMRAVDLRGVHFYEQGRLPHALSIPFLFKPQEPQRTLSGWRHSGSPGAEQLMEQFPVAGLAAIQQAQAPRGLLLYDADGGLAAQVLDRILDRRYWFLSGGFSQFRTYQVNFFYRPRSIYLLTGKTGCGKTRVLRALQALGAAVVDLEALAGHRGSVFGAEAREAQPSPPDFLNRLWEALKDTDPAQPVFLEQKGAYIGHCPLPVGLWEQMITAKTIRLTASIPFRINRLADDYAHLSHEDLLTGLDRLQSSLTASLYAECRQAIANEDPGGLARLLLRYYDESRGYQMYRDTAWRELNSETEEVEALARRVLNWVEGG